MIKTTRWIDHPVQASFVDPAPVEFSPASAAKRSHATTYTSPSTVAHLIETQHDRDCSATLHPTQPAPGI